MQRKAYVTGAAACLAVLLAGCTSGAGGGASPDGSKPNDSSVSPAAPGRYRTLPEACSQVDPGILDSLLPGIRGITDDKQREQAYAGTAAVTYDNDRRVGCTWTGESPYATDHLTIDFERVVSYDTTVPDADRAQEIFASKAAAAGIDDIGAQATPGSSEKADGGGLAADSAADGGQLPDEPAAGRCVSPLGGASGSPDEKAGGKGGQGGSGGSQGPQGADDALAHTLDDLGDAAFLGDVCAAPSSSALHRTVTVVFRTSNVIVTVEYDEQPSRIYDVPDGKRMQDTAEELAHTLSGKLGD